MLKAMIVHKISTDFNAWKKVFDSTRDLLKDNGALNYSTGTTKDDPKNVYVMCDFESMEKFNKFMNLKELKEAMKKSGVIEEPHITILNEIDKKELVYQHAHS